jgi:hypothetical protein
MTVGNVGGREWGKKVVEVHYILGKLGNSKNIQKIRILGITWA